MRQSKQCAGQALIVGALGLALALSPAAALAEEQAALSAVTQQQDVATAQDQTPTADSTDQGANTSTEQRKGEEPGSGQPSQDGQGAGKDTEQGTDPAESGQNPGTGTGAGTNNPSEPEQPTLPAWKRGWVKAADGSWYWGLSDGTFAKDQWVKTGGKWYLMGSDGVMLTGVAKKGESLYYLCADGTMATGWAKDASGSWYLASSDVNDGHLLTGWQKVSGSWYWFDPDTGKMATGVIEVKGSSYLMTSSGAMSTGWAKVGGAWYLSDDSGALQSGWVRSNGSWYYLDPTSHKMATGWANDGKADYYLSPSGAMLSSTWVDDADGHHWLSGSGTLEATVTGDKIVYADAAHAPASGLTTIGDTLYYADPETGELATGEVVCEDGVTREFDENTHAALSGWSEGSDGQWYYLRNGLQATGWQKVNDSWYYLDPQTGAMQTGWQKGKGAWYYLGTSGRMKTGWQKVDGTWYYLDASGTMKTGWLNQGGTWYYLKSSGAMVTGWYEVSECLYQFAPSGLMYEPQMEPLTDGQRAVVAAAKRVPSPGGGLCSEWVSQVFAAAGYRHVYADACDDYWWYCNNGDVSQLKVGMIIAVPSHTHSYLASIYGHVCIYIGNGLVMDNAGYGTIRVKNLYEWLAYYDTTYQPLWGWYDSLPLC